MEMNLTVAKSLYGFFFCVVIPFILFLWATHLPIMLPAVESVPAGIIISICGLMLLAMGMFDLRRFGNGLPMNAFPPENFVAKGSYKLVSHPIYTGFCIMCAGVSVVFGSASGLYVVTPVLILLCLALVIGYEEPDLKNRFGSIHNRTFFGLPDLSPDKPQVIERIGAFVSAFAIWAVLYELFIYLGKDVYWIDTMLSFERSWPVLSWMEIFYALTYLFVGACPFVVTTRSHLREFLQSAWWCTAIGMLFFFAFPFYASPRPFEDHSLLGDLLMLERELDGVTAAFPSFHVLWSLLAFVTWTKALPRFRWLWIMVSILIIISCVAVGVHSIADVFTAMVIFTAVIKRRTIYEFIQYRCEKLANSWRQYMFGGFRIINHSLYAGLAAATGIFIASQFSIRYEILLIVTASSIVGGAVWGQWLEGSSKMLRPFGYYGALIGGVAGVFISSIVFEQSFLVICAVFALASPLTQAIGRLRCLVQGCCHGAVSSTGRGIRYTNEHSRVCRISELKGVPLHNTQLYSIVSNIVIAVILFRLWIGGSSPSLIIGLYFILSGVTRFAEEAYRGESQTKIVAGLRVYQWFAVVAVISGMLITIIPTKEIIIFKPVINLPVIASILAAGLGWAFAMGMDFPKSTIRFSRLTG